MASPYSTDHSDIQRQKRPATGPISSGLPAACKPASNATHDTHGIVWRRRHHADGDASRRGRNHGTGEAREPRREHDDCRRRGRLRSAVVRTEVGEARVAPSLARGGSQPEQPARGGDEQAACRIDCLLAVRPERGFVWPCRLIAPRQRASRRHSTLCEASSDLPFRNPCTIGR